MQVNLPQRSSHVAAGSPGRFVLLAAVLLAMSMSFVGCDEQPIESYEAPKGAPSPIDSDAGGDHSHGSQLSLTTPEGWNVEPPSSPMIFAAFAVGEASNPARVTVTPLGGDGGGLLQNVNRWRSQVGLAPVNSLENQLQEKLTVNGQEAAMFDIAGPANDQGDAGRIMVAVVVLPQQGQTWFFKMTGPKQVVGQHKQGFIQLVESFSFAGG